MAGEHVMSRRGFLTASSAAAAVNLGRMAPPAMAALLQAACSARDDGAAYTVLSAADARDLAAMAARILPTTDTPGAEEAGVVHFFDQAFAGEMADMQPFVLGELAALNTGQGRRFAELEPEAQDALLGSIESGEFFELVRVMTLFGFFAMSRYGGNRDHVGWELIGFEGHHGGWQYPFGYYDAEAARQSAGGESADE